MAWVTTLAWLEVPVARDGGEDHIGSTSNVRAYVGWDLRADQAAPVALILRNRDGRTVTPAQWRGVKTSEIIEASRYLLRIAGTIAGWSEETAEASSRLLTIAGDEQPRASKYEPEHYRQVAELYNAAVQASDPQPVQTVRRMMRQELGLPNLKETTVRGWIRTAKARRHITTRARKPRREQE